MSSHDQQTTPISGTQRSGAAAGDRVVPAGETSWSFPFIVAVAHLAIVQLAATLALKFGTSTTSSAPFGNSPGPHTGTPPPNTGISHWLVDPLRLWDGLWYRLVALDGYNIKFDSGGRSEAAAAFWPTLPWMMRGLSRLTGGFLSVDVAGYIIVNLCFVAALVLLYQLVTLDLGERIARMTCWSIALFPTALFFSAVYTESPFLLFMVGALYAARREKWWIAGGVGLLAAMTRSYGLFLVLPFAVLFIQQRGWRPARWLPEAIALPLPLLGPVIFSWHLYQTFDGADRPWYHPVAIKDFAVAMFDGQSSAWAWKSVQEQWNRYSAMPWETMRWAFSQSPNGAAINYRDGADWSWLNNLIHNPGWSLVTSEAWRKSVADSDTLELVCTLLFLGLMLIGIWKLPLYQTVYLIPGLIVPLFQPSSVHVLMSMPRFGLTLFPLFVVIGILLANRSARELRLPLILGVTSSILLVLLTMQFANWYWVS